MYTFCEYTILNWLVIVSAYNVVLIEVTGILMKVPGLNYKEMGVATHHVGGSEECVGLHILEGIGDTSGSRWSWYQPTELGQGIVHTLVGADRPSRGVVWMFGVARL